ncbi:MAG: hypothetical protein ACFE9S_01755 [Candidatus Hermodarchaeota archaeon]
MKNKITISFLIAFLSSTVFLTFTPYCLGMLDNLKTSQAHIFDGLYANYTGTGSIAGNVSFTYIYDSGTFYNVSWREPGIGITSTWREDTQTRLISDATGGFGGGSYTPIWIFTNMSIGNSTTIVVDGGFNHPYTVVNESVGNYPEIGNLEVWVLEDDWYSTHAWYEKSTGLLINGTFQWFGGSYTLTLTETNMPFPTGGGPGIPGFEIFLVLPLIGIITLLILQRRQKIVKIKL